MGEQEQEQQATILCISSAAQGQRFLREAMEQGCSVLLLTLDSLASADWPRDALTEVVTMPAGFTPEQVCMRVSYLSRHHRIDRIVALSAQDVETAALLREHIRLPGMGQSTTRLFSDRLAMRTRVHRAGVATPEFISTLNYDDLRSFMEEVPKPWLLTPRSIASGERSTPIDRPQKLWRTLDELGDNQGNYLLERAVTGTVFYAESVCCGREAQLSRVRRCSPARERIAAGEGMVTQLMGSESLDVRNVLEAEEQVLEALGMAAGITHTEFVRADEDGRYCFLEAWAGAGPALGPEVIAASTGIDPWVEWARIEAAAAFAEEYKAPRVRARWAAGSVVAAAGASLAGVDVPEVFYRSAGGDMLVVRSESQERVAELLVGIHGGL